MKLAIDTRSTNIKVIDDILYRIADKNEIISLINTNKDSDRYLAITNIIGDSIGLKDSDKYLYYKICYYLGSSMTGDSIAIKFILKNTTTPKYSNSTIRKGISNLIAKGVITYSINGLSIRLTNRYNVNNIIKHNTTNEDKLFIVIEL